MNNNELMEALSKGVAKHEDGSIDIEKTDEYMALAAKSLEYHHRLAYMSPSQRCRATFLQTCDWCDRIECCDNTSPAKQEIDKLKKQLEARP